MKAVRGEREREREKERSKHNHTQQPPRFLSLAASIFPTRPCQVATPVTTPGSHLHRVALRSMGWDGTGWDGMGCLPSLLCWISFSHHPGFLIQLSASSLPESPSLPACPSLPLIPPSLVSIAPARRQARRPHAGRGEHHTTNKLATHHVRRQRRRQRPRFHRVHGL